MNHGSLFSGIGGFDLAAEWMGWQNIFHCEWNEFGQKILKHYWPNAKSYGDITKTDFTIHRGEIDIVTGGFPCQPYSTAGKRKGKADDRHLWPEMLRAIREIQPSWIVGENVPGLLNWERGMVLDEIKVDLENEGFEVFPPLIIPACAKDASHIRYRLWIVAYSSSNVHERGLEFGENKRKASGGESKNEQSKEWNENGQWIRDEFNTGGENVANTESNRINRAQKLENDQEQSGKWRRCDADNFSKIPSENGSSNATDSELWGCKEPRRQSVSRISYNNFQIGRLQVEPLLRRGDDGLSNWVDRIKGLGNAIVPQVVFEIFKAIEAINETRS